MQISSPASLQVSVIDDLSPVQHVAKEYHLVYVSCPHDLAPHGVLLFHFWVGYSSYTMFLLSATRTVTIYVLLDVILIQATHCLV